MVEEFTEQLTTKSGLLCRLLLCANVARATLRTKKELPLSGAMARTADTIVAELAHPS
ncbi:hypothetical protein [Nocardiopsis alkaliphila]|uniref:hypothetical protein n=1 Tax=Nocardiopsis alkaliphila TaxID=225762 RepID=UPI00034A1D7D|nr:hypothetical protein [Nocardiopsis alkaliphila]